MKFEDWFNEVESFGLRSERFFGDLAHSVWPAEKDRVMVQWLRAAYEAGRAEQNHIDALIDLSTWAADFKTGIIPDSVVHETISTIVDAMNVEDPDAVIKSAMYPWTGGYDDE